MHESLYRHALKLRQVLLYGDIEDESAERFITETSYLLMRSKEPIFVFINSKGGCRECELMIIDQINSLKLVGVEVWTLVIGVAFSAAGAITAMGSPGCRMARPNSGIMLHPCSLTFETDYVGNQKELMRFCDRRTELENKQLAKACGMENDYEKFVKDIDKGLWLTAEEAVKYGIIDGIWPGPLPFGGP